MTQPWGGQPGRWPEQQDGSRQPAPWPAPVTRDPYVPPPGQPGYPPFGYPPAPYPGQPQGYGRRVLLDRPPRRNPLPGFLGGLALVIIAGFFVITLLNYLNPGTAQTPAIPSTEPTYGQNVRVPAPDRNPPALPAPDTYDQATTWLRKNAIYAESVPVPTACKLDRIDASTVSTGELEAELNQLTACLWTVWNPPITSARFELPRPTVTVYGRSITTACGQSDSGNAFYCSADQQIYYAQNLYQILPRSLRSQPFVPETVLAHEFGHAIQARTGILIAEGAWQQKSSDSVAAEFSRRTETQADCLGGLFLNAVQDASAMTQTDLANIRQLATSIGDDALSGDPSIVGDHGLSRSRLYWFDQGLGNARVGVCNTFTAAKDTVR